MGRDAKLFIILFLLGNLLVFLPVVCASMTDHRIDYRIKIYLANDSYKVFVYRNGQLVQNKTFPMGKDIILDLNGTKYNLGIPNKSPYYRSVIIWDHSILPVASLLAIVGSLLLFSSIYFALSLIDGREIMMALIIEYIVSLSLFTIMNVYSVLTSGYELLL